MMHQKSLFNPKLAFEDMKQNKHVIILYTVALLLCTLFPASLEYSNYFNDTVNNAYSLRSAAEILALSNPFVMMLTFAAAFIIVILQFNYLYKQSSVIFVHSMPYTRANIIVTKYISGLLAAVLPILLVGIINMFAAKTMGIDYLMSYTDYNKVMIYCILSTAFCYSVMVMAQTVSSGIFSLLIATSFVFLLYPITKGVLAGMVSTYLRTYNIETLFSREIDYIFPFWKIASAEDASEALTWGFSAYLVISSIVMLAISALVYSKRKSENSNKFFAFNTVNKFLKYYITIVLSLGVGALTGMAAYGSFGISYVMYIVSAIIIFAVLQAIFDKNIKNMFANKLSLGAVLLVITAVVCMFKFDVFKLNDRIPDAADTKSIGITLPLRYENYVSADGSYNFTDKKTIEKAILLMKNSEPAYDRGWTTDDNSYSVTFITDKYKKLGISRRALVKKTDLEEFSKAVFETAEFKKQLTPDESQVEAIYWTYVNYGDNESFNVQTKAQIEKLLKTYSAEVNNISADEFVHGKVLGSIEYEIPIQKNDNFARPTRSFSYRRAPVFESCTETLKLMEQYRAEFEESVKNADNGDEKSEDNADNAENAETTIAQE
ncbi:hypothetical protein [Qingrenia yutianensis]|uniref:ABC transporter permease n=1 Tax=Qingrenia yutianensis TaxID=2763676 RepID=A0A926IT43_9FIRM|nr:hypothetical protein [Qingrenia yutianensis]MBC8596701.1 ABC transporter permease [Qingrenia yutianensis]